MKTGTKVGVGGTLVFASAALMAFLGKWEEGPKRQLTVYADKLANGLPTVCKGITKHVTATPVIVGEYWGEEKCDREEQAAVVKVQRQLIRCFKVEPPQSVWDAATSHAWNNGAANTCGSLALVAWNARQWELGCRRIARSDSGKLVWSYRRTGRTLPNGKPEMEFVQGLANRREDEVRFCLEDVQ